MTGKELKEREKYIKKLEAEKKRVIEIAKWYMQLRMYPTHREELKSEELFKELKVLEKKG